MVPLQPTGTLMSSDGKLGADLPSGPFQREHHCIPSCCFLSALNRSLPASCSCGQETNLAPGKQAAQRDAWTMPGLWVGLLFPSYAVRHVLSCQASCPVPPATALSLALQAPLLPRPLPDPSPGAETHRSWFQGAACSTQSQRSQFSWQHRRTARPSGAGAAR